MSIIRFNFDQNELRGWLTGLAGDVSNGFVEACKESFFETYITSTAVLDVCLDTQARKPFLPFARQCIITEPGCEVAGVDADSFDVVILPNLIERVSNPFKLLRSALRALRVGGLLIVSMPLRDLYERKFNTPSRWDLGHRRFYTVANLLLEAQAACGLNAFRIRYTKEFDGGHEYDSTQDMHARGSYCAILVLEKVAGREWYPDIEQVEVAAAASVDARQDPERVMAINASGILNPGLEPDKVRAVCVLKVDHIGDFAMALPVFDEIRAMFRNAELTCVCGSWNADLARSIDVFDHVVSCDYYKRDEKFGGSDAGIKALAVQRLGDDLAGQQFDLAIDLRVPDDARRLLMAVPARYRAGIGRIAAMPFLDIALPNTESFHMGLARAPETLKIYYRASAFSGREITSRGQDFLILKPIPEPYCIFGPYVDLERGSYRVRLGLIAAGPVEAPIPILFDVASMSQTVTQFTAEVGPRGVDQTFEFEVYSTLHAAEFRVSLLGGGGEHPLVFSGVEVERISGDAPARSMPQGQVHMKEQMVMLLALIRTRLFGPPTDAAALRDRLRVPPPADGAAGFFVVVPFSNSEVRDWPIDHYAALMGLLLAQTDAAIRLIGAPSQAGTLAELAERVGRDFAPGRISVTAGRPWAEVYASLANADAVVANNSGMAHVAAALGARVLAIYSASHQTTEWGPLGPSVTVLQATLRCGRCGFDTLSECQNGLRCMQMISPELALQQLRSISPGSFVGARSVAGQEALEPASS